MKSSQKDVSIESNQLNVNLLWKIGAEGWIYDLGTLSALPGKAINRSC